MKVRNETVCCLLLVIPSEARNLLFFVARNSRFLAPLGMTRVFVGITKHLHRNDKDFCGPRYSRV